MVEEDEISQSAFACNVASHTAISNPVGAYRLLSAAWGSLRARVCDTATYCYTDIQNIEDRQRPQSPDRNDRRGTYKQMWDIKGKKAAFKTD